MHVIFCVVTVVVFVLSNVASAQSYSIRVTNTTNLRATYSTRSRIVEAVTFRYYPAGRQRVQQMAADQQKRKRRLDG